MARPSAGTELGRCARRLPASPAHRTAHYGCPTSPTKTLARAPSWLASRRSPCASFRERRTPAVPVGSTSTSSRRKWSTSKPACGRARPITQQGGACCGRHPGGQQRLPLGDIFAWRARRALIPARCTQPSYETCGLAPGPPSGGQRPPPSGPVRPPGSDCYLDASGALRVRD